jgi:uncharacterized protein (TIGR03437 family)
MIHPLTTLLVALSSAAMAQNTITTYAGSNWVFPNGSKAVNAPLGQVQSVATDAAGNVFISNIDDGQIYKVDPNGVLALVAGNGTAGFSGDGGPATAAALNFPRGIAVDSSGNLYIADTLNNRVRKVTPAGVISTLAGTGAAGFSGDGGPATAALLSSNVWAVTADQSGNVYIADRANNRIRRVGPDGTISTFAGTGAAGFSGDGGPATSAALRSPAGLAVDSAGNVYISDTSNQRVRRIVNGVINTVAGTGQAGFSGDGAAATSAQLFGVRGLAVAPDGTVYVADSNNFRVRRFTIGGVITTVAGTGVTNFTGDGGLATSATLSFIEDIALASDGRLFLADFENFRVRVVNGGNIATFAGNGNAHYSGDGGPATNAVLNAPSGLARDKGGNLYICDQLANRIRRIDPFGTIDVVAGSNRPGFGGDGGPATQASMSFPVDVKFDPAGNLYIADSSNNRVRKVTPSGVISTLAGTGATGFSGDGGAATAARLNDPSGLALDAAGNLYVSDLGNFRVRKITPAGIITTFAGNGTSGSGGDGGQATNATLTGPVGLAFDSAGNLYIADAGATVVRKVTPTSVISTFAGNGQGGFAGDGGPASGAALAGPQGVSVDGSGNVNIVDSFNNRIRQVTPDGKIHTIAGIGTAGLSGDGGPATAAELNSPYAIDIDLAGNLYIADGNGRIRLIRNGPPPVFSLSQTGLTLTVLQGGGAPLPQTITVLNSGAGALNWTASASTTTGQSWLSVSPARGTSSSTAGQPLSISANPTGLAAGAYYGLVQVTSPGVANSPQFVTVVLNVLSTTAATGPAVQPTGLIFSGAPGGASPQPQAVQVAAPGAQALTYTSSISFGQGSNWLVVQPASGSIAANQPAQLSFQTSLSGLQAGVYSASVTLSFAGGSARRIDVLLVVSTGAPGPSALLRPLATGCVATRLNPVFTLLGFGFSAAAGWPISLEAKIVDDCGQPMVNGSVTATFTNNDPALAFSSLRDGRWSATWAPRSATQVGIALDAQTSAPVIKGSVAITGILTANPDPPQVASGGVLNAASYTLQAPVAPGALVAIFGAKLSQANGSAAVLPLASLMNGTTVSIAGRPLPLLFTSDGQVNAMLPYDLAGNATLPLIVQRGTSLSIPEPVRIAASQPAIFTTDLSGKGQGIVLGVNADGSQYFAQPGSPAAAGAVLVIYCAGLGAVQPTIGAGLPAAFAPLAVTSNPVTVSIGGVDAPVQFAGLTPGFTGLYQVNAVVPGGVTGSAVPITLSVSGQTSPSNVTIAVQ